MKKLTVLVGLSLLTLLFVGCKKDEQPNYAELIRGTWVNTLVNEMPILTDATFVMEFKAGNIELYAAGFQLDDNNKSWKENNTYTYSISGDFITIDGTDVLNNSYHLVFKIILLNQGTLSYAVQTFAINGTDLPNDNSYTCEKVTRDFSDDFTGVWYGHCTSGITADPLYHYWEYFADGSYNYYYQDENSNWIKKADNEGHYFIYGQLFASNYTNDLISGDTGLAFECWDFTLDGNNMTWTGLRENNTTVTYEMEKVPAPPVTIQP